MKTKLLVYSHFGFCTCPKCGTENRWHSDFTYTVGELYMLNHPCKGCDSRLDQPVTGVADKNWVRVEKECEDYWKDRTADTVVKVKTL